MELIQDRIRLVVFDMAGTTVQDLHEVENCFASAAKETGLEMTPDEIRAVQGWSKKFVFETFWERQLGARDARWGNNVQNSYALFKELLEHHYLTQPVLPTEGCLETLQYLQNHDIAVGLTTGFYRKVANIILERLGWLQGLNGQYLAEKGHLIQSSVASDEVANGRPDPEMILLTMQRLQINDPSWVLNIGDTPSDIESGKRAGVYLSLAVSNGTHTKAQLDLCHPDGILSSLGDLSEFLNQPVR